jgi:ligand-binding sensor domain-containing protein/signal transduction histidine kinase
MLLWLGLLFLASGNWSRAWALDPALSVFQYNCQTWRRSNGLPASTVTAIAQTEDGRMWLGTSQGIVYFDGMGFRLVSADSDEGGGGKVITGLARGTNGRLWFGLERGSFGYFDGKKFTSMQREEWGGMTSTIRSMQLSPTGKILVGGTNLGVAIAPGSDPVSLLPVPNADVSSIYEDPQGRIWMGTADSGLFYWENGRLSAFPDQTLRKIVISAIAVDHTGNIWVGTSQGLRRYDPSFQERSLGGFSPQPRALLVDRHGAVWIGTGSEGLFRYQESRFTRLRKQDGLASDRVTSLAESDDGSLWVGTEDGLSQLSDVKFPILSSTEGLVHEGCLTVAAAPDGSLWAGTPDGVSHYRGGRFENFGNRRTNGFNSNWVKRVFVARNGDAYFIGARRNLDRFSGDRVVQSWINPVWPRAVAEDTKGILVALEGDLMRIEDDKFVPYVLADGTKVSLGWINDVLVDRNDSIWIAAVEGVFQIKDGVLHNRCHENAVYQDAFYRLSEDGAGNVWAAQNTGIARFKDGGMRPVTKRQGLHDDFVYAIVADLLGNLWMDSSRGIFTVSERELNAVADGTAERVHCTVYDGENSVKTTDMIAQEYSGCRTGDGRIWFPSSRGIIQIDPAHVPHDSRPPPVLLDRVLINGREYATDREPVLEPAASNLEFDYAALSYQAPQKVLYRYRLEGFAPEWVEANGRRAAFYTNLRPGRYRFQVQACNADGVWNRTGASFAFELPLRFYETIWFRLVCATAAVGIGAYVWWVFHLRRKHAQLQRIHEQLELKVEERTAELRAEIGQRISMQQEVQRIHRELLETSRQAGMAEVATGVLHNVGNVLNSLNVSATLLDERLRNSKISSVARLRDLLGAHTADLGEFLTHDPKGRQVPEFLDILARHLAAEQAGMVEELGSLRNNVEHIKDIVSLQQNYATASGVTEIVPLTELVEDALRMNESAFERHAVAIIRDYQAQPVITVEKHKVLQILVNLLRNAKYACDESGRADRRITVRVSAERDRVSVAVIDNGVGIPADNLTLIFSHGFTTRKTGHGFGLHNGALTAKILGGSLDVHSDGPDTGATFTLHLPFKPLSA